jgi:hypothetical protein
MRMRRAIGNNHAFNMVCIYARDGKFDVWGSIIRRSRSRYTPYVSASELIYVFCTSYNHTIRMDSDA